MELEQIFSVVNGFAAVGWLIMLVLHNHPLTPKIIISGFLMMLSALYVYLLASGNEGFDAGSFSTLQGVMTLFQSPKAVLAGWVHYLAFDMLAGLLIVMSAGSVGINRFVIIPCLLLCFMLGPSGWLLYYIVAAFFQKTAFPKFFMSA
jgi:hypothetical protein